MPDGRAAEYFQAVKIMGSDTAQGKELRRHFLTERRGRTNNAALDYTMRLDATESENGEVNGILVEWKDVRMADDCAHTPIKIQTLTNDMQNLLDG